MIEKSFCITTGGGRPIGHEDSKGILVGWYWVINRLREVLAIVPLHFAISAQEVRPKALSLQKPYPRIFPEFIRA